MLEPGPLTALLGGPQLLESGQLQVHGRDKSLVRLTIVMVTVMMTIPPGDVRDVPVERPLPRRGLHGEEVGLPHPEVIQLHSQQVSTDRFVRNKMNEVLI